MKRWPQNCGLDVDPTRSNPCLAGESWAQPLGRPDPSKCSSCFSKESSLRQRAGGPLLGLDQRQRDAA